MPDTELKPEMESELNQIGKHLSWIRPYDEALGLPSGSIRAILAIMVVVAAIVFIYRNVVIPEWYAVIAGIILRDYFAGGAVRDVTKLQNGGTK